MKKYRIMKVYDNWYEVQECILGTWRNISPQYFKGDNYKTQNLFDDAQQAELFIDIYRSVQKPKVIKELEYNDD